MIRVREIQDINKRFIELEKQITSRDNKINELIKINKSLKSKLETQTTTIYNLEDNFEGFKETNDELKTLLDNTSYLRKSDLSSLEYFKTKQETFNQDMLLVLDTMNNTITELGEYTSSLEDGIKTTMKSESVLHNLSDKQEELINLIKKGLSNKEIAKILGVSGTSIGKRKNLLKQKGLVLESISKV